MTEDSTEKCNKRTNVTGCSRRVPHTITNPAHGDLTSEIRRDQVYFASNERWYQRDAKTKTYEPHTLYYSDKFLSLFLGGTGRKDMT
jgi:hypothetical protein